MGETRNPGWAHTLADVERAVGDCLAALDRYEAAFAGVLAERGYHHPTPPEPVEQSDGWAHRLGVADRHADQLDRLLAEQEAVWVGWRETYSAWRRSLEQPPG